VLGLQIFITEFTEAILFKHTAEDLLCIIRPHPSFEEGVTGAIENLCEKLKQ